MPAKRSAFAASVVAFPAGRGSRARLCLRLALPLSFLLLLAALLRTQPLAAPPAALPPSAGPGKVAFLFLVRAGVPLDFLWDAFFRNGDEGRFSVYVHSAPGFELDRTTTGSPYFYGRQLARSVKVAWGDQTMVEAERMLFAAALEDPTNQHFVLLSDSCVPLYNFSYIYSYLMASPKSSVDSFIDKPGKRYNPNMSPSIPKDKWRKGSQWLTLIRKHAEVVVGDKHVFQVFRKHCKMTTKCKQGRFMDELLEEMHLELAAHDFRNFQHMVNKAIVVEEKRRNLQKSCKHKRVAQISASSSSQPPREWRPQPPRFQALAPPWPQGFVPCPPQPRFLPTLGGNKQAVSPLARTSHVGSRGILLINVRRRTKVHRMPSQMCQDVQHHPQS